MTNGSRITYSLPNAVGVSTSKQTLLTEDGVGVKVLLNRNNGTFSLVNEDLVILTTGNGSSLVLLLQNVRKALVQVGVKLDRQTRSSKGTSRAAATLESTQSQTV